MRSDAFTIFARSSPAVNRDTFASVDLGLLSYVYAVFSTRIYTSSSQRLLGEMQSESLDLWFSKRRKDPLQEQSYFVIHR